MTPRVAVHTVRRKEVSTLRARHAARRDAQQDARPNGAYPTNHSLTRAESSRTKEYLVRWSQAMIGRIPAVWSRIVTRISTRAITRP